jgi:predicted anti-sigma-YlaC factor YlaD
MSGRTPPTCGDIQMAVMARLDGEAPVITPADIDVHVASCSTCRAAVADITTLHAKLDRLVHDQPDVDLWPMVRSRMTATLPHLLNRERSAITGLAVALGT